MKNSLNYLTKLIIYIMALSMQHSAAASGTKLQKKLEIVTTVAPITNIVQNIAGIHANVTGIVPNGIDSHTFEPIPSDIKTLQTSDIIIVNGLDLELPTILLAQKIKKPETPILQLGNQAIKEEDWQYDFSFPREDGHPNPHLWLNVEYVMRYVKIIREALIMLDPSNKSEYLGNADSYLSKLRQLDQAIFNCVETIPINNRKLVTYHDSFAYFAPRYNMTVIAAIQPSDFSEPGPQEMINIIKQIRNTRVPAIFGSEVFPSKIMQQIARETKAKFVDQLSDDELPAPPNQSFIGMMINNIAVITNALGGNPTCMENLDASNIIF